MYVTHLIISLWMSTYMCLPCSPRRVLQTPGACHTNFMRKSVCLGNEHSLHNCQNIVPDTCECYSATRRGGPSNSSVILGHVLHVSPLVIITVAQHYFMAWACLNTSDLKLFALLSQVSPASVWKLTFLRIYCMTSHLSMYNMALQLK